MLKKNVLPSAKGRGGLDLDACRLAYIAYLRSVASAHRSEDGELDLTEERAKLARAQTEEKELKNAVLRNELIPADDVLDHWAQQVVKTKTHLRALPHQVKSEVPHLTVEEVECVKRLVERALNELADGLPDTTGEGESGVEREVETAA